MYFDCTHTSHCGANTGIQRVARRLGGALAERGARAVVYDPYAGGWRFADSVERRLLAFDTALKPGSRRGARWSLRQKLEGYAQRYLGQKPVWTGGGVVFPEVFGAERDASALADLRRSTGGPLLAVFHDLIPLQLPAMTPVSTIAAFREYLDALRTVDVVAAVSEASCRALSAHWKSEGVGEHPRIVTIPLASDPPRGAYDPPPDGDTVKILCVGSVEGRKNHLAMLGAAEALWAEGLRFELDIIGLVHASTGAMAAALAEKLRSAGRPLRMRGAVSDDELEVAYEGCHFTVYPSLLEGFGLPVIESLSRGRPCVCSGLNAMAETAAGGGCELTGNPTVEAIARAMRTLILNRDKVVALSLEARGRRWRSWSDYADDIVSALRSCDSSGA